MLVADLSKNSPMFWHSSAPTPSEWISQVHTKRVGVKGEVG